MHTATMAIEAVNGVGASAPALLPPRLPGPADLSAVSTFNASMNRAQSVTGPQPSQLLMLNGSESSTAVPMNSAVVNAVGNLQEKYAAASRSLSSLLQSSEPVDMKTLLLEMARISEMHVQVTLLSNVSQQTLSGMQTLFRQQNS